MNSIIDTLPAETIETLLCWCEEDSYQKVSQRAAKPLAEGGLNLRISAATLCRLYTRHGIADSKQARTEYLELLHPNNSAIPDPQSAMLDATSEQLQLRLFELATRPNPSLQELRLVFQITTRLRALQLSERRVVVAEKRETRQAAPPPPPPVPKILAPDVIKHRVRVLLGKEAPDHRDQEIEEQERQRKAYERRCQ